MIDRALIIMLFMYMAGGVFIAVQYTIVDEFGMILYWDRDNDGYIQDSEILEPHMYRLIDENRWQDAMNNIQNGTDGSFDKVTDPQASAGFILWELMTLLSGTYIFNFLVLFGMPEIFVVVISMVFWFLLGRAAIGYIFGR